ncbi:hypothetical protein GKE82_03040 [Conexibacter sp. W3-3-2]|uniref:hypothetical protein n=1 Tax=Conexibacter sp. W3-3-2 TaxID=2675227 RepID=UPI0012B6C83C|nr:hypothetical protein [Conexibacter sp. W3-3-2]MTD43309.1 hypothetical protein [Conexibacter sp. W3-3-2]
MQRFLISLAAACAVAATIATPSQAGKQQLSVFQDDRLLVLSGDSTRERTLDDLQELGVDTIHSVAFWHKIAPAPTSRRRPSGFDGSDPAAYPAEFWDKYDGLVRGASVRGMDLILSPSAPIPSWASGCPTTRLALRRTCRPNLTQFKRFVAALGTRYSGEYADENQGRGTLPRVTRWSVWNEPNQGGWLTPQYARVKGRVVSVSPVIYRGLVRSALKALQQTGHGSDDILLGETAPLGRRTGSLSTRPTPPTEFLRDLLCLDARGRKLTGSRAQTMDCRGFTRIGVSGVSHHPYTRGGSQPPTAKGLPTEITMSSASRLKAILTAAGRQQRLRSGLPIWYTEYGFQTNPPDELFGVSLEEQARFINQSDFLAYQDRAVRSVAQYELRDEANLASFQTGLRFNDGRPKPAFAAYRLPIWVARSTGGRLRVWGQVRPAADDALEDVEVQNDPDGSGDFSTVETVQTTDAKGFIDVRVPSRGGTWRLRWTPKDGGATVTSRVARVGG